MRAGDTDLTAAQGRDTGVDLDRIELASAPGGKAAAATAVTAASDVRDRRRAKARRARTQSGTPAAGTDRWGGSPQVSVSGQTSTSYALHVTGAQPGKPFWLVLGQSLSPGWTASAAGSVISASHGSSTGTPTAGS